MNFRNSTAKKIHIRMVCSFLLCFTLFNAMFSESQSEIYNGHPVWSPDGQGIAYISNVDGNRDLWIMQIDGNGSVNLTSELDDLILPLYSWSPDGDTIAFISLSESNSSYMWLTHLADLTFENLTRNFSSSVGGQPEWSLNGEFIAYVGEKNNDELGVWIISVDGEEPVTIDIADKTTSPQWSVENTLFFVTYSQAGNFLQRVDSELRNFQILPIVSLLDHDIASDGKRLVYATSRDNPSLDYDITNDVVIYSLEQESETMRLSGDQLIFVEGLKWSPDGRKVTFSTICDIELSSSSIWLLDSDSGSLSELVGCEFGDSKSPDWSPNSKTIAFQSKVGGDTHVWTIDVSTKELVNLTASLD